MILFVYLFLTVLALHCCLGFSLVAESGGDSSLQFEGSHCSGFSVPEHGLYRVRVSGTAGHGLSSCASQALEHKLSSCGARA